jgi:tyrosine-protein phosphatase SIW14
MKYLLVASLAIASAGSLANFQKVDDHVYRGAQPTDAGFNDLAKMGIKVVLDLRDVGEHSQADEQAVVNGLGMKYVSIPMAGLSAPKDAQVAAAMALLNGDGPVFVHCRRGADRTGTVIAVYRISHDGWENKKALAEAKSHGLSALERGMQHYVLGFTPSSLDASNLRTSPSSPRPSRDGQR